MTDPDNADPPVDAGNWLLAVMLSAGLLGGGTLVAWFRFITHS